MTTTLRDTPAPAYGARASRLVLLLAAALLAGASGARAADEDLPARVGRLAEVSGQAFISPEDRATEWQPVGLNYPVASGDNLWVGADGRAEVDYGAGQFRLGGDTNLHVSRLDETRLALFLAQGRLIVRVRTLEAGDSARVDAPNTQIDLRRPGLYRIEVSPDRLSTMVVVREGEALVGLVNGAQQALPGQTATVRGTDPTDAIVVNGVVQDELDAWSATRDRGYERPRTSQYVSSQMVGAADLDQYGTWQTTPDYGAVWYPTTVAAGWAPYRDGYWTEVGGWGLTWVDAAPWGYAPFHYGRWMWIGGRWGWCPGAYVARPIWAPALVGWYGGLGWGVSINVGAPAYGWVPLAWGEPYTPWWRRCSYNCWAGYNRGYAVDVRVRPTAPPPQYRHLAVPGAATVVAATTISRRLPVATNRLEAAPQYLARPPVLAAAPAVPAGPMRIPGARPGTSGTPAPASTFYPVSRPGRMSIEAGGRPATVPSAGMPGTAEAGRGGTMTRSAPGVAPAPGASVAQPSRPGTTERGRPVTPSETRPGTTERSRASAPPAAAPPAATPPAVAPGYVERPRPVTPSAAGAPAARTVPSTQAVPATPPASAAPGAPSRPDSMSRSRASRDAMAPPAAGAPQSMPAAPVARPSPSRPQQVAPQHAPTPGGATAPAPAPQGGAVPAAQPAPRGEMHREQGKQTPKGEGGNAPPARP